MPRTRKTTRKSRISSTSKSETLPELEMEMGRPQNEYGSRRTTPRSAARQSTVARTSSSKATARKAPKRKAAKRSSGKVRVTKVTKVRVTKGAKGRKGARRG